MGFRVFILLVSCLSFVIILFTMLIIFISGANAVETVADSEGVPAIEYGASAEDEARTTHARVCIFYFLITLR